MDAICSFCQKKIVDGTAAYNNGRGEFFVVMKSHEDSSGMECEGTYTTPEVFFKDLTDSKSPAILVGQ